MSQRVYLFRSCAATFFQKFIARLFVKHPTKTPYSKLFVEFLNSESGDSWWVRDMANALIKAEDINAITVDWGDLVDGLYNKAVDNINIVGKKID